MRTFTVYSTPYIEVWKPWVPSWLKRLLMKRVYNSQTLMAVPSGYQTAINAGILRPVDWPIDEPDIE